MTLPLLITTLGRLRGQTTLRGLPAELRRRTWLVVQQHEAAAHEELWLPHCAGVVALPPHVRSLGATRQHLVEERWGERFVLLDDDLTFYVRPDRADWHLREPTPSQVVEMFEEVDARLDDYAHVGVSGREGNNRVSAYGTECTRYMRLLAWNTALWPEGVRCDRVSGMSDFDTALQLLRAGRPSYVFSRYAQGQSGTQAAGGCALDRTHDTHAAEVARMVELHPGLVSRTEKRNKSGGAFGVRDEVVVEWKRALLRVPPGRELPQRVPDQVIHVSQITATPGELVQ